jgi:hypothetical protein
MKKYDELRGGHVPQANTAVMDKYRTFLLAKRAQQLRQAAKKLSVTRGRERMDSQHDELLQFMLATKRRAQYFEPRIGDKVTPLFVRVKVRHPKFGIAPTVKWVLQHLTEKAMTGTDTESFMTADEEAVAAFRTKVVESFRSSFAERAKVETHPAELYVSVDYAKANGADGQGKRFSKVNVRT